MIMFAEKALECCIGCKFFFSFSQTYIHISPPITPPHTHNTHTLHSHPSYMFISHTVTSIPHTPNPPKKIPTHTPTSTLYTHIYWHLCLPHCTPIHPSSHTCTSTAWHMHTFSTLYICIHLPPDLFIHPSHIHIYQTPTPTHICSPPPTHTVKCKYTGVLGRIQEIWIAQFKLSLNKHIFFWHSLRNYLQAW